MIDLFSLAGRTALVTGGARGVGAAITREFLTAGARVIVCARKTAELETALGAFSALGEVEVVVGDVSTLGGVQALMAEVALRTDRLHVLVNNAGAAWAASVEETSEVDWDTVADPHARTLHYLTAAALPLLRAAASAEDPARVINIGSLDGIAAPMTENHAHVTGRAAVHELTRQHATRLAGEHILVNAIAPGPRATFVSGAAAALAAATATIPTRRINRTEEIGGSAVYLASRAGAYTTGTVMVVDTASAGAARPDGLLG